MPRELMLGKKSVLSVANTWESFLDTGIQPGFGGSIMGSHRNRLPTRRRRIIYNEDGDSLYMTDDKQDFLAQRLNSVLNTDVDTYFWNMHSCMDKDRWTRAGLGDETHARHRAFSRSLVLCSTKVSIGCGSDGRIPQGRSLGALHG